MDIEGLTGNLTLKVGDKTLTTSLTEDHLITDMTTTTITITNMSTRTRRSNSPVRYRSVSSDSTSGVPRPRKSHSSWGSVYILNFNEFDSFSLSPQTDGDTEEALMWGRGPG